MSARRAVITIALPPSLAVTAASVGSRLPKSLITCVAFKLCSGITSVTTCASCGMEAALLSQITTGVLLLIAAFCTDHDRERPSVLQRRQTILRQNFVQQNYDLRLVQRTVAHHIDIPSSLRIRLPDNRKPGALTQIIQHRIHRHAAQIHRQTFLRRPRRRGDRIRRHGLFDIWLRNDAAASY